MQDENKEAKMASRKKRLVIVIAILSIIVAIQCIRIYTDFQTKKELKNTQEELSSTVSRLHEIQRELDQSIAEVGKLGGDVTALKKAKAEVEEDLKNARKKTQKDIQRLKSKVVGYEHLLKLKDKELVKLKKLNKALYSENTVLKTTQNELADSITQLSKHTEDLTSKVTIASRLKAENIAAFAVNNRGKERKSPFKKRQIGKLKIAFNLAENEIAPVEGKKILIRITDPNKQVIFDVDNGSGTFMLNGKEEFYTAAQEILFDNTLQKMVFSYQKKSAYTSGTYRVEVFTDNYLMGTTTFEVK